MKDIRNIALVGATGSGKTSLAEQMLFNSKTINRVGKVDDGNTVMDYNAEEIEKGMSMTMGIANFKWKKNLINIIDTPGYADFAGEAIAAAAAVENILFVANATSGFEVSLEQSIELLGKHKNAKAFIINRMDGEGADFNKALDLIRENTSFNPVPIYLPIGAEEKFVGVVDIVKNKAIINRVESEVPADMVAMVAENRMALMEAVAESDDALLEKYFEEGKLTEDELINGLTSAVAKGTLVPAFATSASTNIGVTALIEAIVSYLISPADAPEILVEENEEQKLVPVSEDGKLIAYIFKSFSDPNVGDIAYVRVFSGVLKSGLDVFVPEKNSKDRVGSMYKIVGKNRKDATELKAGDIGGLVKLKVAHGLDSLVELHTDIKVVPPVLPTPVFWQTIKAVNQHDEDKIGTALNKLLDEDPTIFLETNAETSENILNGIGEHQIGLIKKKLKSRYNIDAELFVPAVPYKETIKKSVEVNYKHKKQSGGKGQYGDVYLRIKPLAHGEGIQFINAVVGGTIPSKFIPAIEKGLHEVCAQGIISGNPIVDMSVEVYFGSYHDVDSSEMAFKIATWQCIKKGFEQGGYVMLEPLHDVKIIIPDEYMGDVMGDISSTRRGKIVGMEQKGKKQILNAQMPLSELFKYYPALKSMTQGRGKFEQTFSHYDKVPKEIAEKVIAAAQEKE